MKKYDILFFILNTVLVALGFYAALNTVIP